MTKCDPKYIDRDHCLREEYELVKQVLKTGAELEERICVCSEIAARIKRSRQALDAFEFMPSKGKLMEIRGWAYLSDDLFRCFEMAFSRFEARGEECYRTCDNSDSCYFANLVETASNLNK